MIETSAGPPRGNDWVIHYQYFAGGQTYESTDLFPGAMLGPVETRLHDSLVSSLPDGSQTTAWYVDDDPSRAYLVRERLFTCYDLIIFADVFFCAGLLVARRRGEDDTPKTRRGRRRTLALAWTGIGGLALAHYLLPWPEHWPVDFLVVAPLWAITSLVAIVVWTRTPSRTAGAGNGRVGP